MDDEAQRTSRSSPYTRAMQRQPSSASSADDAAAAHKWREPSAETTSEAPTPAPESTPGQSFPFASSSSAAATPLSPAQHPSTYPSTAAAMARADTHSSNGSDFRRGVDADDEDVRIAIAALGAMKNLDGRSFSSNGTMRASASSASNSTNMPAPSAPPTASSSRLGPTGTRTRDGSNASMTGESSIVSSSSIASPAISSPSSTPATELTQASFGVPSGSVTSSSRRSIGEGSTHHSGRAATLADLPSDFEFPAIVQDEDGNEVQVDQEMLRDADFLDRVSHLPIVRGTLRAYEMGKQRSKIVKYGGDLVESSVKAISRPVVGRLGASLGEKGKEQLDDFACRQLDRFYPTEMGNTTKEERQKIMAELDERERTEWAHMDDEERAKRRRAYWALFIEEKERETVMNELRQRRGTQKGSPADTVKASDNEGRTSALSTAQSGESRRLSTTMAAPVSSASMSASSSSSAGSMAAPSAQRALTAQQEVSRALVEDAKNSPGAGSRWGSMLVEAGATAGGLSAAMSEESMKSLKYCLQWLQYATAHIEHQITVLRDLVVKLNHGELELTTPATQNLAQIKGDVVNTIRSVVDVVGKYAGGALPKPARVSVKAFILSLPARWATVNRAPAVTNSASFGGSPASPSFSPAHLSGGAHTQGPEPSRRRSRASSSASASASASAAVAAGNGGDGGGSGQMSAAATAQAANRVLTLAVESLDILRSVTVVVGESLDRADLWVERLRMLGLQRKRGHEHQDSIGGGMPSPMGRIEASPWSGGSWESARGLSSESRRRDSIGAGSDVSMGTSASIKRRRTRVGGDGGGVKDSSVSASASSTPVSHPHFRSSYDSEAGGSTSSIAPGSSSVSVSASASSSGSGTGGAGGPDAVMNRRRKSAAGI